MLARPVPIFCRLIVTAFVLIAVSQIFGKPIIPLKKGQTWTYSGKVDWTEGHNTIKSKNIEWTATVLDAFTYGNVRVAVVKGLPDDLDWYTEGKPKGYYVMAATAQNAVYRGAADRADAYRLAREFRTNPMKSFDKMGPLVSEAEPQCKNKNIPVKGFSSREKRVCGETTWRTNPDIQIIDFVNNLGIIRYYYNHFGTVSTVDVELKEIRYPSKKKT